MGGEGGAGEGFLLVVLECTGLPKRLTYGGVIGSGGHGDGVGSSLRLRVVAQVLVVWVQLTVDLDRFCRPPGMRRERAGLM